MTAAMDSKRLHVLILCYDSGPIQDLLWPMAQDLQEHGDCLFLCQFPSTLRALRERGFQARSIRSVLGWEHGTPVPKVEKAETLIPLDGMVDYEMLSSSPDSLPYLVSQADSIVRRFKDLLDVWRPSLVLAWNGHTLPFKPCVEFARLQGIPVRLLERGFFPGSLFVDRRGTNAMSSVKHGLGEFEVRDREGTLAYIKQHIKNYQPIVPQDVSRREVEHGLRGQLGLLKDTFLLFVPEQLEHDSNTVLFSKNVKTNRALVAALLDVIESFSDRDVRVLYKPHPEHSFDQEYDGPFLSSSVEVIRDIPLAQLLAECDAVVTRNSTLGFEGLLFGKRCLALGESMYSGLGITDDVSETTQLFDKLKDILNDPELGIQQSEKLLVLVERLRLKHHYFIGPGQFEGFCNGRLVDEMLSEARTASQNFLGDYHDNFELSIWDRLAESLWDWRLIARRLRSRIFKGAKWS